MSILVNLIILVCQALTLAIFARVILSWFSLRPGNMLVVMLDRITEPLLGPLRRIIPRVGVFDFSPIVAILILRLVIFLVAG